MILKQFLLISIWVTALILAFRSGAWSSTEGEPQNSADISPHDRMFHMHMPLHEGGKVGMSGQYHIELAGDAGGRHRLWVSNAFRQELDPGGFIGTLTIEQPNRDAVTAKFSRVGRTKELIAETSALQGQAWLIVNGTLGNGTTFRNMRFFWNDDSATGPAVPPPGLDPMVPVPEHNALTAE
ncbi:MAG: hypothetical protein KDA89_16215, partial [Planctomycetaceae bacterium]|nr:hypothetical protein [Planctomycetaceae bacterium]